MTERHMSLPRVAFWLVPRLKERFLLQEVIAGFAKRYSSPAFLPHVTLYSCHRSEAQQELCQLAALAKKVSPFSMHVDSLGGNDRLAQAFCLELRQHERASQLYRALTAASHQPSHYIFKPHLSLIYQDLPDAEREKLLNNWTSPLNTICFDQVWAVAIPARIEALEDFFGWQPLLACQLDSPLNGDTL